MKITDVCLFQVSGPKPEGGLRAEMRQALPLDAYPEADQIRAALRADPSQRLQATYVEIHTGRYSDAGTEEEMEREFDLITAAAQEAYENGLRVNAGHGLNYVNTSRVAALETIEELSIGHAIMARAIFVGLDQAVREMLALMI